MKLKWMLSSAVFLFLVPGILYANGVSSSHNPKKHAYKKTINSHANQLQQEGSFSSRKNAENFARKLRSEGQEVVIKKGLGKNGTTAYRVFIKKKKGGPAAMRSNVMEKRKILSEIEEPEETRGSNKNISAETVAPAGSLASAGEAKQVALLRFADTKEGADRLSRQLSRDGYSVTVRQRPAKGKGVVYSVFAQRIPFTRNVVQPAPETTHKTDTGNPAVNEVPAPKEMPSPVAGNENPTAPGFEPPVEKRPSEAEKAIAQLLAAKESRELTSHGSDKSNTAGSSIAVEGGASAKEVPAAISHEKEDLSVAHQTASNRESPVEKRPSEAEKAIAQLAASKEAKESLSAGESKQPADIKPAAEEVPTGSSKERVSSEVFGQKSGFVHPFAGVTGYYTDNVFNTRNGKVSDFITIFSPGIWLTVPHVKEKLLNVDTSNVSPGGYSLSRYNPETFTRYQTYLYYNADIEQHTRESAGNAINHKAEGLFQYNLRGGLTFELMDQFIASHDMWGTGLSQKKLDRFRTNLADVMAVYDTENRLKFRLDYSYNLVDYLAARNSFRDRSDNSVAAYVFYKLKPKTALFYEYEFVGIDYRDNILSNSDEHHNFIGVQWDVTAKSKGSVKAGYGLKYFSDPAIKDAKNFIFEAQIDHKLTAKTSVIIKAARKTEETNISSTGYEVADSISGEYLHRLTGKITLDAMLSYTRDKYSEDLTLGGITKRLADHYYVGMLALQYKFKEWLELDSGYMINIRDSSFPDLDYKSNIVFLRITGSM